MSSVLRFDLPPDTAIEVLVVDGMSTDGTREIIAEVASADSRVRLIDNPGRIQSIALNRALQLARGEFVIRLDAHSFYPPDYVCLCLETAQRTGADNVGGLFITQARGDGYQAALVQALTTHPFGVGDASYRLDGKEGAADTVPYGCFRREVFAKVGPYDERLVRAQDYEINRRIACAGGTIWRNPKIRVLYYQQPDLIRFLRKQIEKEAPYNAYLWYVAPYAFAWRHAITGVFAVGVLGGLALGPMVPAIGWAFVGVMLLYFVLAAFAAWQQSRRYRKRLHLLTLPPCFFLYHFLHGLGVVYGLARLVTRSAPVQRVAEPWPGAGRARAWPTRVARA